MILLVAKEKVNGSPKVDGQVKGCPNTVNPYHTCVEYCRKRYGENAVPQPPKVRDNLLILIKDNQLFLVCLTVMFRLLLLIFIRQ